MTGSAMSDNGRERAARGRDGQIEGPSAPPKIIEVSEDFLKDLMNKVEFLIEAHKRNEIGKMVVPYPYILTPQVDRRRCLFRDEDDTHHSSLRSPMRLQTRRDRGPHHPCILRKEPRGVQER